VWFAGTWSHDTFLEIFSPVLHWDNTLNRQSLQAIQLNSALEASTFHSLHTRFAHQLIAGVSVEQNSIGHTQLIISQDFKWIPEGLLTGGNYCRNPGQIGPNPGETWFISTGSTTVVLYLFLLPFCLSIDLKPCPICIAWRQNFSFRHFYNIHWCRRSKLKCRGLPFRGIINSQTVWPPRKNCKIVFVFYREYPGSMFSFWLLFQWQRYWQNFTAWPRW
jgi:hypothetical protein